MLHKLLINHRICTLHICKSLLDMHNNYALSKEYYDELIFMLKAYGYNDIGIDGMRQQVISHEAEAYYDERYSYYYETYAMDGMTEAEARQSADSYALKDQLDFIRVRVNLTLQVIA